MLRCGCSILLFSLVGDGHASTDRNDQEILSRQEVTSEYYGTHSTRHPRREQSACSAPSGGCGYGLWNKDSCECDCIPGYCFESIFQSCIVPGSCNAFEGCTPYANCPYFPNPMTGLCESGSTISPGVFTVFSTLEECCMENYPSDPSSCLQVSPTASPSMATAAPTASPQAPESQTAATASPQAPESQTAESQTAESQTIELQLVDTVGVLLTPIPINFYNIPPNFELNNDRRGEMKEVVRSRLTPSSDAFNVTLLSVDIVDKIFDLRQTVFSDQDESLPLELRIEVTGRRVYPVKIHTDFLNILQEEMYEIATTLKGLWGPELYTENMVLSIGDAKTTSMPSPRPTSLNGVVIPATQNDDGGKKSVPIWPWILCSIVFVMLSCGLLVWRQRRDKDVEMQASNHISYFDEEASFNQSRQSQTFNQPRRTMPTPSINSIKSSSIAESTGMDPPAVDPSSLDPSRSNLMSLSVSGMEQRLEQPEGQINTEIGRIQHEKSIISVEEEEEDGYDGGKSSFLITSGHDSSDDSSDQEVDIDNSSTEEGNVLGLLYYDGASSAGESDGRESGRSRRSRRSNRSGRTTRSSARSSRHSSGRSSKSKTSGSQKSRRKKSTPLKNLNEEEEQQQEQQQQQQQRMHRDPEGFEFHGNNTYATKHIKGNDPSGSLVYSNAGQLGNNPLGQQSMASHGSTIRSEDSHHRGYTQDDIE